MTTPAVEAKIVQKLIAVLSAVSDVTKYTSTSRIYGAHIATITDRTLPAISIFVLPSAQADVDGICGERIRLQVDLWFNGVGENAYTWDNLFECAEAIKNALHRTVLSDNTIGIKIVESTLEEKGPQMMEDGGKVLHVPLRFRFRAALP